MRRTNIECRGPVEGCCEFVPDHAYCGRDDCICNGFEYCNEHADFWENPTGCEIAPPCIDYPQFCLDQFCCDPRPHCNAGGVSQEYCIYGVEHCLLYDDRLCDLAFDAYNYCCSGGYCDDAELPPWGFPWPPQTYSRCENPCSDCPEGEIGLADDPLNILEVEGSDEVYCSGYAIKHDCGTHCTDQCNTWNCNLETISLDPLEWGDEPDTCERERANYYCDDGLDCTKHDTCVIHSWTDGPCNYENEAEYEYACSPLDPVEDVEHCDPPFCTHHSDGLPGVTGQCRPQCGDKHGYGRPPYDLEIVCDPSLQYPPFSGSGCYLLKDINCHFVLPAEVDDCHTLECDEDGDFCYLQGVNCNDGIPCTTNECVVPGGCRNEPIDDWCYLFHPYEEDCTCVPEDPDADEFGCVCAPPI